MTNFDTQTLRSLATAPAKGLANEGQRALVAAGMARPSKDLTSIEVSPLGREFLETCRVLAAVRMEVAS